MDNFASLLEFTLPFTGYLFGRRKLAEMFFEDNLRSRFNVRVLTFKIDKHVLQLRNNDDIFQNYAFFFILINLQLFTIDVVELIIGYVADRKSVV